MQLFVCVSGVDEDVVDLEISLLDGCTPQITATTGPTMDSRGDDKRSSSSTSSSCDAEDCLLEPAVWFKVMVIDELCIDCITKVVSWNCKHKAEASTDSGGDSVTNNSPLPIPLSNESNKTTRQQTGYKYHMSQSSYGCCADLCGYDAELDEVFDAVPNLVASFRDNTISIAEFQHAVKRLLHIYILPSIRLTVDDIDAVRKCVEDQESHLKRVDDEIMARSAKCDELRLQRKRERARYVDELTSGISEEAFQAYSSVFSRTLLDDLTADITESSVKLDAAQMGVDAAKQALKELGDDGGDEAAARRIDLAENRRKRDDAARERMRCLEARETLKEIIVTQHEGVSGGFLHRLTFQIRRGDRRRGEDPPIQHAIYVAMRDIQRDVVAHIRSLTDRKLLMVSVKEALRSALDELTKGQDTYGVDVSATGAQNATDVLTGMSVSRTWQTLAQQVSSIITDPTHILGKQHFDFCRNVIMRCQAAIYEKYLFDEGLGSGCECEESMRADSVESIGVECLRKIDPSLSLHSRSALGKCISTVDIAVSITDTNVLSNKSTMTEESLSASGSNSPRPMSRCALNYSSGQSPVGTIKKNLRTTPALHTSTMSLTQSCATDSNSPSLPSSYHENHMLTSSTELLHNGESSSPECTLKAKDSKRRRKLLYTRQRMSCHDDLRCFQPQEESLESVLGSPQCQFYIDSHIDNAVVVFEETKNYLRAAIETLKRNIYAHFNAMCTELQGELGQTSHRYYNKIWLCYESSFYNRTMDALNDLYMAEYKHITQDLDDAVRTLNVHDLGMDDSVWSNMLLDVAAQKNADDDLNVHYGEETERTVQGEDTSNGVTTDDSTFEPGIFGADELPKTTDGRKISLRLKTRYRKQFARAAQCLAVAMGTQSPFAKLQHLNLCLREISHEISEFCSEMTGEKLTGASSDELMDVLVIILCNIDGLPRLYTQIMLLADIIAPSFTNGGSFSFTLAQFFGACHFIQDRLLLKRHRQVQVKDATLQHTTC